jgi:hypothetical protein
MFRFTTRDVLWLTAVIGLLISWVHERYALERMRTALHDAVDQRDSLREQISAQSPASKDGRP